MIHSILEWKNSIDIKNALADGKCDSVAEVQSIYLPSDRDSEDASEKDLTTEKKPEAEEQHSNTEKDNTDDEHEEENPIEDEDNVDGQDEDDDPGSADDHQSQDDDADVEGHEEGAIQSININTKREEKDVDGKQPLLGLVLTPTRELAVQVKHHIDAVAQFTGLWY